MKIAAVLVVALATFALGTPSHAAEKPKAPLTVVTAGDSTVAGAGTASRRFGWPGRLHRAHMSTIDLTNVGHSSSCLVTQGCGYGVTLLSTFRDEVLTLRPDVAIVSIGRNDLCHASTADFKTALRALRTEGDAVGVRVMFGTITPTNERWQWPCEDQAAEVNDWIRGQDDFIDFAAAIENHAGMLPKRYDSGDGLHPNGKGYTVMAHAAATALLG